MYTLPGVPSVYYGSEFGIEGEKQRGSDDSLRPAISYEQYMNATLKNSLTNLVSRLGAVRKEAKALSYGDYKELLLTNTQYAFERNYDGQSVLVTVNNSDDDFMMNLPTENTEEYVGQLSGVHVSVKDGYISVNVEANSGEIWMPAGESDKQLQPVKLDVNEKIADITNSTKIVETTKSAIAKEQTQSVKIKEESNLKHNKPYEMMTVEELQEAILERMKHNGPVTDQMRKDVLENIYHNSLVTWIKSFN